MDWITPQIAIGNFEDAKAVGTSPDCAVDSILCLREDCCEDRDDVDAYAVPLKDAAGNKSDEMADAMAFLHAAVQDGGKILVHCHAGRSRSVCMVAAYLIVHHGYSRARALELIASKREIYLSTGIEEILQWAERRAAGGR